MKFWTGAGDKGKTSLIGGKIVSKSSMIIEVIGCLDELNAFIGLAKSFSKNPDISRYLEEIQRHLFILGEDIASSFSDKAEKYNKIEGEHVRRLEKITTSIGGKLPKLAGFILPGGSILASLLHVARAVCRRAERRAVALSEAIEINPEAIRYLNRLSSTLFILARYANLSENVPDVPLK